VRASIDIINKYTWLLIVFFLGLLYFLSGQGIPIQPSSAMLTGLPAEQRVALKGATDPAANGFPRFLVPKQEISRPEASDKSLDRLERVAHRVRRGDTFGKLLRRFGLSAEESHFWIRSIRKHFSPKRLHVGKIINLYFAQDDSNLQGENTEKRRKKHLKTLELELNPLWTLTWERNDQTIVYGKREIAYEVEIKTVSGTIHSSFHEDGIRSGLNRAVISQFVDIFAWDVNFDKDLIKGDSFKVHYRRKYRKEEKKKGEFHILAAEFNTGKQKHFAIYFEKEKGQGNYYNLRGKSLSRAFLRYPVEFSRISSTFSHRRYHPILKVRRPHRGVDFVARRGTPVRAVGDGKISFAGWKNGAYGRMIEVRHGSIFSSRYAHLRRLARGIRRGVAVKKGQIIGYVGSSGRSTGPHLHYELYKNNRYLNPLKVKLPAENRIEPALRKLFEDSKLLLLAELATTPHF